TAAAQPTPLTDRLTLGDAAAEAAHELTADKSEVVRWDLGQTARWLLPGDGKSWEGGRFGCTMKVDPDRPNYLTARFWGGEANPNYLVLLCEGKQVGYRHLGDVEVLGLPDDEPRSPGRFYYVSTPLPRALTRGKRQVRLEVRASGPIFPYAARFEQYQRPMTEPSGGVYGLYTHSDGCFVPPADEPQGQAPPAVRRTEPGPEVLTGVTKRVNDNLAAMLRSARPLNQMQLQFLARAYFVKWTAAHGKKAALEQVVRGVDELCRRFRADPDELWHDPVTWNPGW